MFVKINKQTNKQTFDGFSAMSVLNFLSFISYELGKFLLESLKVSDGRKVCFQDNVQFKSLIFTSRRSIIHLNH